MNLWIATILLASTPTDSVSVKVISGEFGKVTPALSVTAGQAMKDLQIQVNCGGVKASRKGPSKAKQVIELPLRVKMGVHDCQGVVLAKFQDGSEVDMPLSFQIASFKPLQLNVKRKEIDFEKGSVLARFDRDFASARVQAYGAGGTLLGEGSDTGERGRTLARLAWGPTTEEILKLEITGDDGHGSWAKLELFPWHYAIPHEDVVFETNSAEIRSTEAYKLFTVLNEIKEVVKKYGSMATVRLYVAGYTDTVGNRQKNQTLSESRAYAIAQWFNENGFSGEIYFQGFGERGLKVRTGDGVDEERNRRALYIAAAEAPPTSRQLPTTRWKRLK